MYAILAKNQLEQDARGSADEETALLEFGQFHCGIGNAEGIELAANSRRSRGGTRPTDPRSREARPLAGC
jgi:hypothetical protein